MFFLYINGILWKQMCGVLRAHVLAHAARARHASERRKKKPTFLHISCLLNKLPFTLRFLPSLCLHFLSPSSDLSSFISPSHPWVSDLSSGLDRFVLVKNIVPRIEIFILKLLPHAQAPRFKNNLFRILYLPICHPSQPLTFRFKLLPFPFPFRPPIKPPRLTFLPVALAPAPSIVSPLRDAPCVKVIQSLILDLLQFQPLPFHLPIPTIPSGHPILSTISLLIDLHLRHKQLPLLHPPQPHNHPPHIQSQSSIPPCRTRRPPRSISRGLLPRVASLFVDVTIPPLPIQTLTLGLRNTKIPTDRATPALEKRCL